MEMRRQTKIKVALSLFVDIGSLLYSLVYEVIYEMFHMLNCGFEIK